LATTSAALKRGDDGHLNAWALISERLEAMIRPAPPLSPLGGGAADLEAFATARNQPALDVDTTFRRHQERERAARLEELPKRPSMLSAKEMSLMHVPPPGRKPLP
jgi:hypothetical protein